MCVSDPQWKLLLNIACAIGIVISNHMPPVTGCGCDSNHHWPEPTGRGFCDNWTFPLMPKQEHSTFDCSRSGEAKTCADQINKNTTKGVPTDCSCLGSLCLATPQHIAAAKSPAAECAERCFDDAWVKDRYYCTGFVGNQHMVSSSDCACYHFSHRLLAVPTLQSNYRSVHSLRCSFV
jgi:hypothetical protein